MEIRVPAKTVPSATVQAIAMWGYDKAKTLRNLIGGQMTYDHPAVGEYEKVNVMVLDKGISVKIHFYKKNKHSETDDHALVVFDKPVY